MTLLVFLQIAAAVGCGLIGGVFFAFSVFVMRALARLPPAHGMAAMQSINVVVINPAFLGAFFGTGLAGLALVAVTIVDGSMPGAAWLSAGALLYLVGTIGVTMAANVPLNTALASMPTEDPAAGPLWSAYLKRWTAWNHVRTAAAIGAAIFITYGIEVD